MLAVDKKISLDVFLMGKRADVAEPEYTTVGLTVGARDKLAVFCRGRHGANVREVATALVEWFIRQKEPVQTAILASTDEGMEGAYAAMLRQLADELIARDVGIGGEEGANATQPDRKRETDETSGGSTPPPPPPLAQEGQGGHTSKRRR